MQLGGDVSVEFSPTGLVCDIWVPLAPEHCLRAIRSKTGTPKEDLWIGVVSVFPACSQ